MNDGTPDDLRGNILLRSLPTEAIATLAALGEVVACRRGERLVDADAVPDALLFPLTTIVAIEERLATRAGIGIAIVGRDGFVGWPALLGADRAGHAVTVRVDGLAWRIDAAALDRWCRPGEGLHRLLLQYVHVVMAQIGHTTASQIEHPIERRIAAWILMHHDRIDGDELAVRHEEISDALNSRRASVTDALHRLEGDQLIRCRRERLAVRDRPALQAHAGEAYGTSEALYRRLIAPFGKDAVSLAA